MSNWKKTLICCLIGALVGCCAYTHRRVIVALIKGEELPKAPSRYFWCKNRE